MSVDGPEQLQRVATALIRYGEPPEAREHRETLTAEVIPFVDGARRAATLLAAWLLHRDGV